MLKYKDMLSKYIKFNQPFDGLRYATTNPNLTPKFNTRYLGCLGCFNKLSKEEKDIFLFGFREHKFLKPKGKGNVISDYIRWQGLYSYIYASLDKIKEKEKIKNSQHTEICPFCKNGFKNEIQYYSRFYR